MLKHAKNRAVTIGKQGDNFDREKRGINVSSSQTRSLSRASVMLDERPFQLLDIDASGFSVLVPVDSHPPTAGASVDWTMFIGGNAISFGRATVGATCARRSGTVLRLNATSGPPDPALLEAHQILADLRSRPLSGASLVPPEYKALCADIVARLRAYRKLADKLDNLVFSDEWAAQDLFEGMAGMMASDWKAFSQLAAESVAPRLQDEQSVVALREFTQKVVTPELTEGAIWRRAFEKPRGYPGDYGVMNFCYTPEQIGATSYARLCHRLGIDFVECVRTRKNVVRDVIRERLERQSEVSAMSIACGSAHEIFELASCGDIVNRLQATLVDQDAEALNFAMTRLMPYLRSDEPRLNATTVRAQFGDYTDPNGRALPADKDLVYCFGMFDYLPDDLMAGIVPVLYSKLKPGGTLIIGNLRPAPEMIWPLCFVLGYDMWFRSAEEMLALAAPLVGCRAELKVESTGYNFLLFLHRQ